MKLYDPNFSGKVFRIPLSYIENMRDYTNLQWQVLCVIFSYLKPKEWDTKPINSGAFTDCIEGHIDIALAEIARQLKLSKTGIKKRTTNGPRTNNVYHFAKEQFDLLPQWLLRKSGQYIKLYIMIAKSDKMGNSKNFICEQAGVSHHYVNTYLDELLEGGKERENNGVIVDEWWNNRCKTLRKEWVRAANIYNPKSCVTPDEILEITSDEDEPESPISIPEPSHHPKPKPGPVDINQFLKNLTDERQLAEEQERQDAENYLKKGD